MLVCRWKKETAFNHQRPEHGRLPQFDLLRSHPAGSKHWSCLCGRTPRLYRDWRRKYFSSLLICFSRNKEVTLQTRLWGTHSHWNDWWQGYTRQIQHWIYLYFSVISRSRWHHKADEVRLRMVQMWSGQIFAFKLTSSDRNHRRRCSNHFQTKVDSSTFFHWSSVSLHTPNTSEAKLQFKKFHILILFPWNPHPSAADGGNSCTSFRGSAVCGADCARQDHVISSLAVLLQEEGPETQRASCWSRVRFCLKDQQAHTEISCCGNPFSLRLRQIHQTKRR